MNSTFKSLVFWMVLVVVGVLIWNFSTKFQQSDRPVNFSEFMSWVEGGTVVSVELRARKSQAETKRRASHFTRTRPASTKVSSTS